MLMGVGATGPQTNIECYGHAILRTRNGIMRCITLMCRPGFPLTPKRAFLRPQKLSKTSKIFGSDVDKRPKLNSIRPFLSGRTYAQLHYTVVHKSWTVELLYQSLYGRFGLNADPFRCSVGWYNNYGVRGWWDATRSIRSYRPIGL